MGIVRISHQCLKLLAGLRNWLHLRETKGAEVSIKRVKRVALVIYVYTLRDQFMGNFLVYVSVFPFHKLTTYHIA